MTAVAFFRMWRQSLWWSTNEVHPIIQFNLNYYIIMW